MADEPSPALYTAVQDGDEWGVQNAAGQWVAFGRHAGENLSRWRDAGDARRIAIRMCDATPDDRRRWVRTGLP